MESKSHFRFEDLEIWREAKKLAISFHELAEQLDRKKLYRYAEQLRSAGLSMPNNIAEGAGSIHVTELKQFLNISRRSLFENASMLLVFESMQLLSAEEIRPLLVDLDIRSRKIVAFSKSL